MIEPDERLAAANARFVFGKVGPEGPIRKEWFDRAGNFHRLYENGSETVLSAELIADELRRSKGEA